MPEYQFRIVQKSLLDKSIQYINDRNRRWSNSPKINRKLIVAPGALFGDFKVAQYGRTC